MPGIARNNDEERGSKQRSATIAASSHRGESRRPCVLSVFAPDMLDIEAFILAVHSRVAADSVAFGDKNGVGQTVLDVGEACHTSFLPVFVPAAAKDMPVGSVTRGSPIAPGLSVGRQTGVAGGLEGFNDGVGIPR